MDSEGGISTIRGDDILFELQLFEDDGVTPIDLTGSTLKAQVRTKPNGFVALEFEILQVNPFDGTVYDLMQGKFLLYGSHTITERFRKEEYQWDLEHTSAGALVTTLIGPNSFTVLKDITLLTGASPAPDGGAFSLDNPIFNGSITIE